MDVLKAYWAKIGGKPEAKPKTPAKKGNKRKSLAQHTPEADATSTTKRRGRKSIKTADEPDGDKMPTLPEGSWEDHIEAIESVEERAGGLMFYVVWNNGSRTEHSSQQCRQKCPQKVIRSCPQSCMYHLLTCDSSSLITNRNCTATSPNPIAEDVQLTRPRVFKNTE